jgi:hypothetical protein
MLLESPREAFALLLLVSVAALVLVLRAVRRRTAPGRTRSPKRIHLRRAEGFALKDPAGVEALARPLLDAGFADAGVFVIEEIALAVRFLKGPEDGLYAAVFDRHPAAGTWLDVVTLYEDGTSITVNNLAKPSALDERPGHRKVRLAGAGEAELYEAMRRERSRETKPPLRLQPADIAARFEKAYADEMDWRDARGGPTEAEIRRIAAASGRTLTDEEVKRARELLMESTKSLRRRP